MDIGDFAVSQFGLNFARDKQAARSEESRSQDRSKRAPITTDAGTWANNKDRLDFPGIDTPSESPKVLPKDLMDPARTDTTSRVRDETPAGAAQIPSDEPDRAFLAAQGMPLSPAEAFEGLGTESQSLSATNTANNLAAGPEADMAFIESEKQRGDIGMPSTQPKTKSSTGDTPAGIMRREAERKAAKSNKDTPGLRRLDSRIRAARGEELDTSNAIYGAEELEELNDLFK